MNVNQFILNVTSEDPDRLTAFYADTVGLPKNPDVGERAFTVGGTLILIDGHSETKGAAKEPHRMLINFFVDDLAAEQGRLEGQGVKFIRSAGREEWGGRHLNISRPGRELLPAHPVPARVNGGADSVE